MSSKEYIMRFYHKGEFSKTNYTGGTSTIIPYNVEADRISYAELMDYVKTEVGYTEIGGVYVFKENNAGWKLLTNDADVCEFADRSQNGDILNFYIDNIVDKSIKPVKQMQPHVIIRPRTMFFEGKDIQTKRKFVTIHNLQQEISQKKKVLATEKNSMLKKKAIIAAGVGEKQAEQKQRVNNTDDVVDEGTLYENIRKQNIEKNNEVLKGLNLKTMAAALTCQGHSHNKKKEQVVADDDQDLESEFDGTYVPGHDSLSKDDEDDINTKQMKEVQKVYKNVGPTTRSKANSELMKPVQVNDDSNSKGLLPIDEPDRKLKRKKNEGVGSMAAFVLMRKRQEKAKEDAVMANDEGDLSRQIMTQDAGITGPTDKATAKKYRGPTKMTTVFTRKMEDRKVITLNDESQPVSEDKKLVPELSSFCGTIARQCVPLDCVSWHHFPKKDKDELWELVTQKYIIPEAGKGWVLATIRDLWRLYKSRVKGEHYLGYDNDDDRIKNKPDDIPLDEFKMLLQYWGDRQVQAIANRNAINRKKVKDPHTAGRTSFAQIGNKLKLDKQLLGAPSKAEIYMETRKRKEGHQYKVKSIGDDNGSSKDVEDVINDASHGSNWLIGRRTRKARKLAQNLTNNDSNSTLEDLTKKVSEKLQSEIKETVKNKVNDKLKKIMAALGQMNPIFNVDLEELVVDDSDDVEAAD